MAIFVPVLAGVFVSFADLCVLLKGLIFVRCTFYIHVHFFNQSGKDICVFQ